MKKTWTMKDGTKINIKDMSDSHLVNSAKMVARNRGYDWVILFFDEFRKRGISTEEIEKIGKEFYDDDNRYCGLCGRSEFACDCCE